MTIVVGFKYRDGVLLCGDSQVSTDYAKDLGLKVLPFSGEWGDGIVGFSGTVNYAIAAIQKLERKLKCIPSTDMMAELEKALAEEWKTKIFEHPLYGTDDSPSYDLLLALRLKGDIPRLYVTSETTIHEVATYCCIGIGGELAESTLRTRMFGNLDEQRMLCLASYTLARVKRSVVGCDGLLICDALRKDGPIRSFVGHPIPKFIESIAEEFDRDSGLTIMSIVSESEQEFESRANNVFARLKKLRSRWLDARRDGIPTSINELPRGQ